MKTDSKKLRILVISSTYPRHEEDYAVPWMREAHRRIMNRGHEVTVLAPAYKGLRDHEIDGASVKRFRYAPASYETLTHEQGAPLKVRKIAKQLLAIPYILCGCWAAMRAAMFGKFDLVHVHWPFPHGMMGQVARFVSGAPLVIMSHGAEFALARRKKWIRPFLRQSLRAADLRIANSSDTARQVQEVSGVDCNVLPYGTTVSAADFEAERNEKPRVLFTGRLIERKGVEYLLRAIPEVLAQRDVQFVITGSGEQKERLEKLHDELGLGDSTEFLGFVSNEQLSEEYAKCDVWVNPAIVDAWGDAEGLGVGSIEAYAYRKPVIATRTGGIPDTIRHGETGYLVEEKDPHALAEAILDLINDPFKARKFGWAGLRFARAAFSWDQITRDLEALYASTLTARNEATFEAGRDGWESHASPSSTEVGTSA
ncbi:MAG: glycosyltransferase family 4 protein [Pirellulaceae bacterium]